MAFEISNLITGVKIMNFNIEKNNLICGGAVIVIGCAFTFYNPLIGVLLGTLGGIIIQVKENK
jgi:hypothetical protein